MNAVIANKYKEQIKGLGLEIVGLLEGDFSSDDVIQAFSNFYYEKLILDITSIRDYSNTSNLIVNLKKIFTFLDPTKVVLLLENIPQLNNSPFLSKVVDLNIYNFTFDINEIKTLLVTPKTYQQVIDYDNYNEVAQDKLSTNTKTKILGIKNITEHAGASTLIYMMYLELSKHYSVKCLEIDKEDFKYFYNEDLVSIKNEQLMDELLKEPHPEILLIDLNDYENDMLIKNILYVLEPSVLKLNKLVANNKEILSKLQDKKVILNRTSISLESARQFESESNIKAFDIIRNVNERNEVNPQIMNLLLKLGFKKVNNGVISMDDTERKKTLFDSF